MKSLFTKDRLRFGFILFGIFSLVGFVSAIQFWIFLSTRGNNRAPDAKVLLTSLTEWYLWILLIPILYWVFRRFPIRVPISFRDILLNIGISIAVILGKSFMDDFAGSFIRTDHKDPDTLWDQFMHIVVSPRTFWLFLVYWTIMAVIYMLHYYRELQERKLVSTQLEARLAQAHLDALKMQLQPHFLFNTLNSISSLLRKNVDAADDMIINLSDMLRYSLHTGNVQEVPLREELDFVQHYLDIEKIRFQDRLTTDFQIERGTLDAWVPSMLLQPIVENSIRHGLSKQVSPGKVTIRTRQVEDRLEMAVLDTGDGFASKPNGQGIGLSNTRQRLEKMYGSAFALDFERTENHETLVKIVIPFSKTPCLQDVTENE